MSGQVSDAAFADRRQIDDAGERTDGGFSLCRSNGTTSNRSSSLK